MEKIWPSQCQGKQQEITLWPSLEINSTNTTRKLIMTDFSAANKGKSVAKSVCDRFCDQIDQSYNPWLRKKEKRPKKLVTKIC